MASYGSKRSFLLIFSARDDLVKVSCKSDAWKCQNQLTPPYFDKLSEKDASPFKCRCIILEEFRGKCFKVDYEIVIELTLCEVVVAVIMRDINLTKKILL